MSSTPPRLDAPTADRGIEPGDVVRELASGELVVPAFLAGRRMDQTTRRVVALASQPVGVAVVSDLVQQEMLRAALRATAAIADVPDDDWWGVFSRAADSLDAALERGELDLALAAASACGGLPPHRIARAIAGVARTMRRLPEILAVQAPGGLLSAYRDGVTDESWRWLPAGRVCAVRVPGNFPTMAVEWLQAIAARRPVVVTTSDGDPVVTCLVAAALYAAGMPASAVSVSHGDSTVVWRGADQLVWPGEDPPSGTSPNRVKTYHFGRSKALLCGDPQMDEVWRRLARLAFQGCGRMCTNLSSLAVIGDAEAAAASLAAEFAEVPLTPLDDHRARVAAWPDPDAAGRLSALIDREVAAGAVDMTARPGASRIVSRDGVCFMRPTVLLTRVGAPLFGTELPFPFVAVASVERGDVVDALRESLIVSIPAASASDAELLDELVIEPTIGKVFVGQQFDRGYEPTDPHEGYLADFLFQKKPVRGKPTVTSMLGSAARRLQRQGVGDE